ncbi:exported hypothetical protein [Planktothrix sp. PCC 11201]|uniref:hypothetical protein n=1 Tax=Planktothrix sp. PCC 11201 TaxID=1729650 RepID=UPI00092132A5|nr:hypothetical protein [Planktothrix sp. PCC 11201]SKB11927.1 exported hypothetical protein [Planktothrix sp. PCC 11201]
MNRQLISLALATIFINSLAFVPSVYAQDGQDPKDRQCNDAQTLGSTSGGRYGPPWNQREIRIEMRMSRQCQANWVKADVPKGTLLYLQDENGKTYVQYQTQVSGWNYGDMMNYNMKFRACARLPEGRDVCTSFI